MTISKHIQARQLLAKQRQMTSLIDKDIISQSEDLTFDRTDWVPLYFDKGYAVRSDCGTATAYRAVTLDQQLLWLVFTDNKERGFHATAECPVEAIEQAQQIWEKRRNIKRDWYLIEQAARDLLAGRAKFSVTLEDAHKSPLCSLGIEGFLSSIGMGRVTKISGRMAAMLMRIEPQVGFVIYEAMQREKAQVTQDKHERSFPLPDPDIARTQRGLQSEPTL
ncbi:MAG: hypothetical protein AB3N13_07200 [Arenibacterium sp.]